MSATREQIASLTKSKVSLKFLFSSTITNTCLTWAAAVVMRLSRLLWSSRSSWYCAKAAQVALNTIAAEERQA
jgi:hypothetical protein